MGKAKHILWTKKRVGKHTGNKPQQEPEIKAYIAHAPIPNARARHWRRDDDTIAECGIKPKLWQQRC
eukprot:7651086-Lingulodinium_polyedra.AAC.1